MAASTPIIALTECPTKIASCRSSSSQISSTSLGVAVERRVALAGRRPSGRSRRRRRGRTGRRGGPPRTPAPRAATCSGRSRSRARTPSGARRGRPTGDVVPRDHGASGDDLYPRPRGVSARPRRRPGRGMPGRCAVISDGGRPARRSRGVRSAGRRLRLTAIGGAQSGSRGRGGGRPARARGRRASSSSATTSGGGAERVGDPRSPASAATTRRRPRPRAAGRGDDRVELGERLERTAVGAAGGADED